MKPFATLPLTYLRARLLAQFRRAQAKSPQDRAAMLILASRLNALSGAA